MEPLARIFSATEAGLFTAAAVFARIGAIAFLLPGLGERGIPVRLRLGAAFALTVLIAPLIAPMIPATPQTPEGLARILAAEALTGLAIGIGFRILVFVLQIAGTTAAYHLSISHIFGSAVSLEPEPTLANLLAMGGIVLALQAGLHIALVTHLVRLYDVVPLGVFLAPGDLAAWSTERVARGFAIGVALAFPFVAISFAYNIALGALSRAMPQLLVALVGVPLLVGLGLVTLWTALPEIFRGWGALRYAVFADPFGPLP